MSGRYAAPTRALPTRVPFLPSLLDGVRVLLAEPSIEIAPSIAPCLKTFEKVRILVDRQNLRLDAIKRPIFDRCDETERLVFLEDNAAGVA